jgi:hypothetical protein
MIRFFSVERLLMTNLILAFLRGEEAAFDEMALRCQEFQGSSFRAWLYRIAINFCKNRLGPLEFRFRNRLLRLAGNGHDGLVDGYAVKIGDRNLISRFPGGAKANLFRHHGCDRIFGNGTTGCRHFGGNGRRKARHSQIASEPSPDRP